MDFLKDISITKTQISKVSDKQKFDQARFKRQLNSISEIFSQNSEKDKSEAIFEKYHHMDLATFINESRCDMINHKKLSLGLMYISIRDRRSLFTRSHKEPKLIESNSFIEDVKSLFKQGNKFNQILYGSFLFDEDDKPRIALGYAPLFYSKIRTEYLKKLYFRKISVMTVYNPAFLIERLKSIGFTVETTNEGLEFVHKFDDVQMRLHGWSLRFFINLIINNVHTEDGVVELINKLLKHLKENKISGNTQVNIKFTQYL